MSRAPSVLALAIAVIGGLAVQGLAAGSLVSGDSGYSIRSWETADGLPDDSATAIAQSEDGYIWFGTFNGLVRFNGAEFKVFNPANTPQLPSAGIVNLHLDKAGRLLVSTYRGMVVREGAEWWQLGQTNGSASDAARSFADRANGDVLITTFNGRVMQWSGRQLVELPSPPGEQGQGYLGGADEDGHWWVVQNKFVGRWEDGQWVRTISPPDVPGDAVGCAPARNAGMWLLLGTELRLLRHGVEAARRTLPKLLGGVWSLSEDDQENVWIASYDHGFFRVTPQGEVTRWSGDNGWSDNGRCVFQDRERNLWLGTAGDGLLRLKLRRFQNFGLISGQKGTVVQSICADHEGGVWAATYGKGLFHVSDPGVTNVSLPGFDNRPKYLQSVLEDHLGRLFLGPLGSELRLVDQNGAWNVAPAEVTHNVVALFEDSRGRMWMSDGDGGVARSDGTAFRTFGPAEGLAKAAFTSFAEDSSGAIWVASDAGVFREAREGTFVEVTDATRQSMGSIACLKGDRDGSMWMASSERGLLRWKDGKFAQFDGDHGFPVSTIESILDDGAGCFWMTSGSAVVRARISELHAVADGQVPRLTCQVFDVSDGLAKADFSSGHQPVSARDTRGRLWFANSKGVAMVDPASLRLNEALPPVEVEEVSFYQPEFLVTNAATGRQIIRESQTHISAPFVAPVSLPPGSRRVEIRYACLSFAAPDKVRFQVKLEGLDPAWREVKGRRIEQFQDLAPGRYVFHLRAANNDGFWNDAGASLAFTVVPYYWQTTWFRVGAGLVLVSLGAAAAWGLSRRRVQRALERERVAHELAETRQSMKDLRQELAHSSRVSMMGQLASALAHEINQPLSAILRNAEAAELFLQKQAPDLGEVRAILADIRKDEHRAGEVIERMRGLLRRRKLERTPTNFRDLAEEVYALIRPDALHRHVRLSLDVPADLPLVPVDRVHVEQVLLNLLLNGMDAMNETPEESRRLVLNARQNGGRVLEVSVQDAGPGIPEADLGRLFEPFYTTKPHGLGVGLPISRTIIEAHGGKLWAENRPEGGAVFRFTLAIAGGTVLP